MPMLNLELLTRLLIVGLASYRVARMVTSEDGPYNVLSRFRARFDKPRGKETWVSQGVNCPLCAGFYASLVLLALSYVDYVFYGVLWLAVAGLQVTLQKQERE